MSAYSAQPNNSNKTKSGWSPTDQDIRILEIKIGYYELEDIIAAYKYKDVVLIPLGALSEAIDLAITTKPESKVAQGFIFKKERTFYLDTENNEVTINGVSQKYSNDLVQTRIDDIYVESNLLSKWLGIQLSVNLFASQILITSDTPLPFQQKLEREKRVARSLSRSKKNIPYYPRHYEPYRNASTPFIDQTLRTELRKQSNGGTGLIYNYTTYATADLAKLESQWFLSGNDNKAIEDFRLTLGRNDPESKLLGRLKATEFSFGHIFETSVNLITQPITAEPGFFVSNIPLGRQIEFDKHTFNGDLKPDWQVEIYRNNSLIGYQSEPVEGQYRFEDVALRYGKNHFRLVFYGPQGQIDEEEHHFEVGDSLTKPGKQYYRASLTQDNNGGTRTIAEYDIGIKNNLSAIVNFTSIPVTLLTAEEQHSFLTLGLRSYYDQYFFNFDTIKDVDGGSAIELGMQTSFDDTIIAFEQTFMSNFVSELFRTPASQITDKTRLRVDSSITTSFSPRIPFGIEINHQNFINNTSRDELITDISLNAHNISYNNQMTFQQNSNQNQLAFGILQLSRNTAKYGIRGIINYGIQPQAEVQNTSINYNIRNFHDYIVNVALTHSLIQNRTDLSVSLNKPISTYNLSYGARVNNDSEFSINVNLSVGIGREPRNNQWITNSRSLATNGSISARVFIDENQDGIFDDDDLPLPDVGFFVNGGRKRELTNKTGITLLSSLPTKSGLDISVAQGTLDDPLWSSAIKGIHVIPRAGKTILLDFPIFLTGEIDGTVYLRSHGRLIGLGNVTIEVINEDNKVIASTETAYDGFYIVSNIPIGNYSVRVANKHLSRLKVLGSNKEAIDININERYINGIDFTISR